MNQPLPTPLLASPRANSPPAQTLPRSRDDCSARRGRENDASEIAARADNSKRYALEAAKLYRTPIAVRRDGLRCLHCDSGAGDRARAGWQPVPTHPIPDVAIAPPLRSLNLKNIFLLFLPEHRERSQRLSIPDNLPSQWLAAAAGRKLSWEGDFNPIDSS